jgi:hypothetical protein
MTEAELKAARKAEYEAAVKSAKDSFEAYWAGSASASVARDYRAGRFVTIRAGKKSKKGR